MNKLTDPKSYSGIHTALIRRYGNAPVCIWDDSHTEYRLEWANVTGTYTLSLEDYLPMCASCHRKFDMTKKSIEQSRRNLYSRAEPKGIVQQFKDGVLVGSFASARAACHALGIHESAMSAHLNGRYKSAGGFTWVR